MFARSSSSTLTRFANFSQPQFFEDDRTAVTSEPMGEVHGLETQFNNPGDILRATYFTGPATLSRFTCESTKVGVVRAWVLHLPITNYQFLYGWIGVLGVRVGTLVRVRMGCALGFCIRCISPVYPWLRWMGCRQALIDPGCGFTPRLAREQELKFVEYGFPAAPPAFEVHQTGGSLNWSDMVVRPIRVVPTAGSMATPVSKWRTILNVAGRSSAPPRRK